MKVYGPYKRKDNRKHVVIVHDNGSRQTQSYPRYLMEQHLGRNLLESETVDHINEDPTDDRIDNYQILTRIENAVKSSKLRPAIMYTFNCARCGKETIRPLRYITYNNIKRKSSGPYCSRHCAGHAGK